MAGTSVEIDPRLIVFCVAGGFCDDGRRAAAAQMKLTPKLITALTSSAQAFSAGATNLGGVPLFLSGLGLQLALCCST
jgi:hypothetical protein